MVVISKATEFFKHTMEDTGRVEYYEAPNRIAAVAAVLYTKRLHNGNAFVGPTGLTVYDGSVCYAITQEVIQ